MADDEIRQIPLFAPAPAQESLVSPLDRRSEVYRHAVQQTIPPSKRPARQPIMTIPNILTFIRLLLVPVLLFLWEWEWVWSPVTCAIVFIAASLTDWLDGYLARKLKLVTVFGAFLDPVADKIMVSTSLVLLVVNPPSPVGPKWMILPVTIMICREITMSALREWAAAAGGAAHKAVKVNSLGKWKTALQMVAISVLLMARQPFESYAAFIPPGLPGAVAVQRLVWSAYAGLWAASVLALWSLGTYMSNAWTHFIYPQVKQQ